MSTKDLQVVVKYGKSQKQLKADLVSQSKGHNGSITVNIRLVCGGTHTVIILFKDGQNELTKHSFSFSVKGQPKRGDRVKQGPDYEMGKEFEGTVKKTQTHYETQTFSNSPSYASGYHTHEYYSQLSRLHCKAADIANGYSIYVNKTSANKTWPAMTCKWDQTSIYMRSNSYSESFQDLMCT